MRGKTRVYRLERRGLGPFSQAIGDDLPPFAITCEDVMFKKGDNKRCFLFGCESEAQLEEYFGESIVEQLEMIGFKVKEYLVPPRRIRKSPNNKQVAFHVGSTDAALWYGMRSRI